MCGRMIFPSINVSLRPKQSSTPASLARDAAFLLYNTIPLASSFLPVVNWGFLKMISHVVKFLRAAGFGNTLHM